MSCLYSFFMSKPMKIRICLLLALVPFLFSFANAQEKDATEVFIDSLINQMTLEEKIGQLNQPNGRRLEDMESMVRAGKVGSFLNVMGVDQINELQRIAVEESRLGIPLIIARDVIHGFKTIFPIPLGQAASFNTEVSYDGARVAALEAASAGIRWTFAPMIDISRDPRWGRIAESCGEDPYLTAQMGVAMVEGFQGDSLNNPYSVAACAKHFVAYGASEGGRDYNSTFIPERLMRNVYLPPFEAAKNAGCATFMASFNDNDGVPSSGNKHILTDILRGEWHFDGFVVSDWNSVSEMFIHGFVKDHKQAAKVALEAGLDMDMASYTFARYLKDLVMEGNLDVAKIDEAVRRILRIKVRLGLFENPYVDTTAVKRNTYTEESLAKAQKAAEESIILLKNENKVLPIDENKVKTVALIGPFIDAKRDQLGTWIFDGEAEHTQTPLEAIKTQFGDKVKILSEPVLEFSRDRRTDKFAKAVALARRADVVVVFVGEEAILSGEAHCLAEIDLVGAQSQLIAELAKTGKPLVTVVMAGRPLTIEKEIAQSDAVLFAFHPGTMGGPAISNILFGKVNPSGKTPVTFVKSVGQIPTYYSKNHTGRPPHPNQKLMYDIVIGQRQTSAGAACSYMDLGYKPMFPFGYGLSYTTFEYSNLKISADSLKSNETLIVSFDLKNTGDCKGTEVAQLYVQDIIGSTTRPVRELKRFSRVTLEAGETKTVTFELPMQDMAFFNLNMEKVVEPGDFRLWVGGSSEANLEAGFIVVE